MGAGPLHFYWSEDEVNKQLERIMVQSFAKVYDMHVREKVNMRLSGLHGRGQRVAEAGMKRGLFP